MLLFQLDGLKLPNLALMRVAAHHKAAGDSVELRRGGGLNSVTPDLYDSPDTVYASLIFEKTRPVAERLLQTYPNAKVGGTGWNIKSNLKNEGITTEEKDYDLYPDFRSSIGFSQRGCRLKCGFCHVPEAEGSVRSVGPISSIWRGDPWPREILLLDNDFFGQEEWPDRIREMREGKFKVSFCQGINARFLTDKTAEAIASVDYRAIDMKTRRMYTAWDNAKDGDRLFKGLRALVKHGIKPDNIMVYILLGYWKWSGLKDWEYRRKQLREFGCRPYPMPFERTREAVGFQRWVIGAYDKRIPWSEWEAAKYRPENLGKEMHRRGIL